MFCLLTAIYCSYTWTSFELHSDFVHILRSDNIKRDIFKKTTFTWHDVVNVMLKFWTKQTLQHLRFYLVVFFQKYLKIERDKPGMRKVIIRKTIIRWNAACMLKKAQLLDTKWVKATFYIKESFYYFTTLQTDSNTFGSSLHSCWRNISINIHWHSIHSR